MGTLYWIITIHLIVYAFMLIWAYLLNKFEQRKDQKVSVTIRTVLNYWPTPCFIPFFGPICILTMFVVLGLDELKVWFMTTKFYEWIQNILNKEI